MRTLRELAGWSLLLLVQTTPLLVLVLLVIFLEESRAGWAFWTGLALALLWPRMLLSARRLREPSAEEVAEADGRPPVVVLHRFTRAASPLLSRLLLVQPGLWRDLRDSRLERSLEKSLSPVGPFLPLARPAPPPVHGPVRLEDDAAWRQSLDRHLRRAALAVIVLDGSDANALEIERAAALLGLGRTILVLSPGLSAEKYARLRERFPLLPELDRRARSIRFGHEDRPFYASSIVVHPTELSPQPRPPHATWLLAALAVFAGLFSAIATPVMLDDEVHGSNDLFVVGSLAAMVLAVMLAGLSRRAVRLVPANEAVTVTVAAFPWLFMELGSWIASLDGGSHARDLEVTAVGAAYAAPLLAAAAIILAVGALVRHASGRRRAFATFGAAVMLPFWPLALALEDAGADATMITGGMILGALTLGLAAWSASGEPGRANAPLPIGAAVAGALSLAAFSVVFSHLEWARLLSYDSYVRAERLPALSTLRAAWPWFAMAGPAVIVLVATQFARRASRVALASMAAFLPFVLLCTLATAAEGRAEERAGAGDVDVLAAAAGLELAPGFELPPASRAEAYVSAPADLVIDRGGVMAGGRRVATLEQLALAGDGAPPAVMRELHAVATRGGGALSVATRRDMDLSHVLRAIRAAHRAGLSEVHLVGRTPDGSHNYVRFVTWAPPPGPNDSQLHVVVDAGEVSLRDRWGAVVPVPRSRGAIDEQALYERLHERRQMEPNARRVTLVIRTYPGVEDAMIAGGTIGQLFPDVRLTTHSPY
ncbi:MAG: hypothetical protein M5U28_30130 [Sandaracinaceae bacterium]|nr:hypothetical protein [Sandaracinaceae bacterium]